MAGDLDDILLKAPQRAAARRHGSVKPPAVGAPGLARGRGIALPMARQAEVARAV